METAWSSGQWGTEMAEHPSVGEEAQLWADWGLLQHVLLKDMFLTTPSALHPLFTVKCSRPWVLLFPFKEDIKAQMGCTTFPEPRSLFSVEVRCFPSRAGVCLFVFF